MDVKQYNKSEYSKDIEEVVRLADNLRKDADNPQDISFAELINDKWSITLDSLYHDLGINPAIDSISNIFTTADTGGARWLIPELFRDAMRLGLEKAPIWRNITAAEETISQKQITMPQIQRSDSAPRFVDEAETIPLGDLEFNEKTVRIRKIGRGIKIPYEVTQYVSLDVVSIFLQDFGKELGLALDVEAIDTLINGEQLDGSEAAPSVGTTTGVPSTKAYADYLRLWIRMSRLGKMADTIIGGEAAALTTLDLPEFKTNTFGGVAPAGVPTSTALRLQTPVPANSRYYIHGNVPADEEIILDSSSSLIKFNAQPLMLESERIVSNQTEAFYASLTTGFAKLFTDSALIMDSGATIGASPFPAEMNVDAAENVVIED